MNALELTAPASNILLRNHEKNWVQLSGHEGSFAMAGPGTIWKRRCETEAAAYHALMAAGEAMRDLVPRLYRDVCFDGQHFLELQDLLAEFSHSAAVMDIKLGSRTFLESEVQNFTPRPDLYNKLIAVDPTYPTPEEHADKAVTKLRYMQFRDNLSSSSSLGFRVQGYRLPHSTDTVCHTLKTVRHQSQVESVLKDFLAPSPAGVRDLLLAQLKELETCFQASAFFSNREVIGSSLLLIYDSSGKAGVWLIDFAKTQELPAGMRSVNHRSPWKLGNHEDGFLQGLDNLISMLL
ncbi:hypothetical protein LAZ67_7003194 [Cordylochernes scorpioides]|uniref:Kinase n=1 Tax=Cordylochernes scorpioides TaxID=51811 RepID=A0ABY6KQC2_9ARAC|nr:hypothetical protein LAZ67_7003194 [Cordylochernes scorpioides]